MVLTREQQQVLSALLTAGGKIQDPRVRRVFDKSAVETGLVEANLTNPSGGDAGSAGWRQERASLYPDPTNLTASADRYRQEFLKAYKPGAKSYDLSAAIQRPRADLRGRYKDVAGEAAQILKTVGGSRGASLPADAGAPFSTPGTPGSVDPGQSGDAAALLAALAAQQKPQIASGGLAPPAATARPVLPNGFQQTASSSGGPARAPDVSALLALAATPGLSGQATPGTPAAGAVPTVSGASGATPGSSPATGRVKVAAGANRAGVGLSKPILDFVGQVAGVYGKPLTIGTGSNHNRMTTSGNVSDHWDGNAADIPASGKTLTRLGQDALIAAGMPEAKARQQTGGLFNVGPYQIIFNSNIGGNHYNHLHTGYRAGR